MQVLQRKMSKYDLPYFLNANGHWFVQIFCPIFGVGANECWRILKEEDYKFKKIFPKIVLAWFVCLFFGSFISSSDYLNKFYPVLIMGLAFIYRQAADYLMKDFFPSILRYLSNKIKKDG